MSGQSRSELAADVAQQRDLMITSIETLPEGTSAQELAQYLAEMLQKMHELVTADLEHSLLDGLDDPALEEADLPPIPENAIRVYSIDMDAGEESWNMKFLLGSSVLPSLVPVGDGTVQLGAIVSDCHIMSGLSIDEWNALSEDDREERLAEHVSWLNALEAGGAKRLKQEPWLLPPTTLPIRNANGTPPKALNLDGPTDRIHK